jgi:hypothetical protein
MSTQNPADKNATPSTAPQIVASERGSSETEQELKRTSGPLPT